MDWTTVGMTAVLLLAGMVFLISCRRTKHPFRAGAVSAAGGFCALGLAAVTELALPVNVYTVLIAATLGIPGVAGLAVVSVL